MSEPSTTPPAKKKKARRINVRTPEVMERVHAEVEDHYRSSVVEKLRTLGGVITIGNTTVRLAKQFGFCYGVERAIDLAYAARRVFADKDIYLIGEIIHNPEVNRQLREMGIKNLAGDNPDAKSADLGPDDVVIVPAFGAETELMDQLNEQGCMMVDTTCGDVMSVWKRVRQYARGGKTSIIHGKADHEETRATASRALGEGAGHYLVILTLDDVDYLCRYIREGGDSKALLKRFEGGYSAGFDPDVHLEKLGVANQTTMLKGDTEELQRRIAKAVKDRDGDEKAAENFQFFDTICGATQERQDALYEMLDQKMDVLIVVGGYNSSNTAHLVEIGQEHLPSFFVSDSECLKSLEEILHFDLEERREKTSYSKNLLDLEKKVVVGVTAGASCPNNLIESTILRIFDLRGVTAEQVMSA
ncbi:MAG: 4-hydroxy-3-methylbut-2-enyl diphosphate reductase [Verrucomicrobiales bacterium]|jgi:4-hydroxy-3-methylbut-2-enyl diphosphate reductase